MSPDNQQPQQPRPHPYERQLIRAYERSQGGQKNEAESLLQCVQNYEKETGKSLLTFRFHKTEDQFDFFLTFDNRREYDVIPASSSVESPENSGDR